MNNELKTNCISDIAGYAIRATHPARRAVAEMGFEPIRPFGQGILSPQRLPFRHSALLHRLTHLAGFCKPFPKKHATLTNNQYPSPKFDLWRVRAASTRNDRKMFAKKVSDVIL